MILLINLLIYEKQKTILIANQNLPKINKYKDFDECDGINTLKLANNSCICLSGFIYGDPNGDGCFKCVNECHFRAKCLFPGQCVCEKGFFGDGIEVCSIPIPILEETTMVSFKSSGGENITFKIKPNLNFFPFEAFCKFGNLIIKSNNFSNNFIECITPKLNNGVYKSYVSFSNETWSKEMIFIDFFEDKIINSFNINIYYILLLILILIFLYKLIFFKNISKIFKYSSLTSNIQEVPLQKFVL